MRYYIPLRAKNIQNEESSPLLKLPLWACLVPLALFLLLVLALR